MRHTEIRGTACAICGVEIPADHACINGPHGAMCCSHEGQRIDVWILRFNGTACVFRKPDEAKVEIEEFRANGDRYTFRKARMKCTEVLALGEFESW